MVTYPSKELFEPKKFALPWCQEERTGSAFCSAR